MIITLSCVSNNNVDHNNKINQIIIFVTIQQLLQNIIDIKKVDCGIFPHMESINGSNIN